MIQLVTNHFADEDGNPRGGSTTAFGIAIDWQSGSLIEIGDEVVNRNGATPADVVDVLIDRMLFLQRTKENCECYRNVINALVTAKAHLNKKRSDDRDAATDSMRSTGR